MSDTQTTSISVSVNERQATEMGGDGNEAKMACGQVSVTVKCVLTVASRFYHRGSHSY